MADDLPEYEIRQMTKEEIPQVLDLWRETDLTEGTHSIDTWFQYDPEAFQVAVTNDGTVIGVCAGVLQHGDLAFIGMYAVRSTFQRRGIGRKIWDKVMARVGDRNAGVNPVPEQLSNYRDKAGFPIQSDWRSVVCIAKEVLTTEMATEIQGVAVSVVTPDDADMVKAVTAYDFDVLGFSRERLIPIQCAEEDSVTVAGTREQDGSVCGYGCIRQNIKGNAHVGPLYADDSVVAELILNHLVKSFPVAESKGVTLMTVDCNEDCLSMVERLGFVKLPGTERLYRSGEVDVHFRKVFAQHNLNFSVF